MLNPLKQPTKKKMIKDSGQGCLSIIGEAKAKERLTNALRGTQGFKYNYHWNLDEEENTA